MPVSSVELTATEITAVLQSKNGFIWLATRNGLNRFDGSEVKKYLHDPRDPSSLSHNEIMRKALYEHAGYIWVGTRNGVSRYNPSTNNFVRYSIALPDSALHDSWEVWAFLATDSSSLWLGTNIGLGHLDISSGNITISTPAPPDTSIAARQRNTIASIVADPSGNLLIGTWKGIFSYDLQAQSFSPVSIILPDSQTEWEGYVSKLAREDSLLWIGMPTGLASKNLITGKASLFPPPFEELELTNLQITDILIDNSGALWYGSDGLGLCQFDHKSTVSQCFSYSESDPATLPDYRVISLMQDYEDHLWVGTWNGVAKMVHNPGFTTLAADPSTPAHSLPNSRVRAIQEMEDGTLYLGTEGGLSIKNPITGTFKHHKASNHPDSLNNDSIWAVLATDDRVWLSTSGGGLNMLDLRTGKFKSFTSQDLVGLNSSYLYELFIDSEQTLWLSSHWGGLHKRMDSSAVKFKSYRSSNHPHSISSDLVWPLYQPSPGVLLAGTVGGGLVKLDIENETFTTYMPDSSDAFSISGQDVLEITGDSLGNIWVGMQNTGLNRFDIAKSEFYNFSEEHGLANNEVLCILPEQGRRLWIGTRNGMSVFDLTTNTFTNFYEENGLPSSTFLGSACQIGPSGTYRFGTEEGMISFDPDNMDLSIPPPRLAIASFEVNNEPRFEAIAQKQPHFHHEENTIGIRVAALSFMAPEKNTYSYRLNNTDGPPTSLGTNNFIYLPNLSPGDYTLEIDVKNSAGISSSQPLIYSFTINPPYWHTWWFRLIMMGLIAAFGAAIYQARIRYLIGLAQKEHESKMKIQKLSRDIAADFHDMIGSSLGSVGLDLDLIVDQNDMSPELKSKLDNIRNRVDKISDSRRDMSWVINTNHNLFSQLLGRIRDVARDLVHDDIQLHVTIQEDFPESNLEMRISNSLLNIIREALYNAVKHAQAENIYLDISSQNAADQNPTCTIQIRDDGIGFDPDTVERSEGLNNMTMRARDMGWLFSIEKAPAGGTSITLVINLKMDDSNYSNGEDSDLD